MASNDKSVVDHAHPSDGSFDDRDLTDAQRQEADTRLWFSIFPRSDFAPANVGSENSWEQRKRNLLFTNADIDDLFNNPEMWEEVFGFQDVDDDLAGGLRAALACIGDLHQPGRVTGPGLAIGAIKTLMRNCSLFDRYFAKAPPAGEDE